MLKIHFINGETLEVYPKKGFSDVADILSKAKVKTQWLNTGKDLIRLQYITCIEELEE